MDLEQGQWKGRQVKESTAHLLNLSTLLAPVLKPAGLTLRPFSMGTDIAIEIAGVRLNDSGMTDSERKRHLYAFIAIQSAPLDQLDAALNAIAQVEEESDSPAKRFTRFFRTFVVRFSFELPLESLIEEAEQQISREGEAIEAARVEVIEADPHSSETPHPNG